MTDNVETKLISLQEDGYYIRTAWATPEWLIFQYSPEKDVTSQNNELVAVNVNNEEWRVMPVIKSEGCDINRFGSIRRLPDGQLGFIFECLIKEPSMRRMFSLYAWEVDTNQIHLKQTYPRYFFATSFSVSPNSFEVVQEEGGSNPEPKLHRVTENGQVVQMVPGFFRARSPSWSPDGQQLAFLGNESGPDEKSNTFSGLIALNNVLDYPWNLYLVAKSGDNPQKVLAGIQYGTQLTWFPEGQWLAFSGVFREQRGIFVFNLETREIIRIWSKTNIFDLSPDGKQLVILDQEIGLENIDVTQPIIIDISFITTQ